MIYRFKPRAEAAELALMTTDIHVRLLNCSASGCLIEANRPVPVGTVSTLRVTLGEDEFEDAVQVVRCQPIGDGAVYHVGTQFLATTPPYAGTLRALVYRESTALAGSLRTS